MENKRRFKKIFEKIHINCIWTEQKEQVLSEQHYLPRNEHVIQLLNVPILTEEVWVNEITQISIKEMEHVRASYKVKEVVDVLGRVEAFWVKWNPIQNLQDAGAEERTYKLILLQEKFNLVMAVMVKKWYLPVKLRLV